MQNDSVEKIVTRYFATLTRVPFEYQGKVYRPKILKVSPLLLRGFTCPPMCGGCCPKFTLDYLPGEDMPSSGVSERVIQFNGKEVKVWTDPQLANDTKKCRHLQFIDGRCGIYLKRPFSCDFELIRTLQSEDPQRENVLTQKLFGRGWSYARVDGGKGALCEMTPADADTIHEVLRKLKRFKDWADHFGLETHVERLIDIIDKGLLHKQLKFYPKHLNFSAGLGL